MSEQSEQKSPMNIIGNNLVVLIGYTIIARLTALGSRGEDTLGSAFLLALLISVHVIVCLSLSAINRKYTRYWLLSSLLVLLIGFSSCWIAFSI